MVDSKQKNSYDYFFPPFAMVFAHESRRAAVRLNTSAPGREAADNTARNTVRDRSDDNLAPTSTPVSLRSVTGAPWIHERGRPAPTQWCTRDRFAP